MLCFFFFIYCIQNIQRKMNPQGVPPLNGAAGPVSRVELRVECKDLKKKDEFSKSDPCAALYVLSRKSQKWEEVFYCVFLLCLCDKANITTIGLLFSFINSVCILQFQGPRNIVHHIVVYNLYDYYIVQSLFVKYFLFLWPSLSMLYPPKSSMGICNVMTLE